uniref:(northern house mosquito) hypothetical protein n=1 Tax=Culex pipiens TaxID=7175 RepID=A0A8D8PHM6_CULPI
MSGSGRAGGTRPAHLAGAGAAKHAGRSVPAGRERQGGKPEAALGKPGPRPVHREPDVGLVRFSGHEPAGPGVRFRLVVLVAEEEVRKRLFSTPRIADQRILKRSRRRQRKQKKKQTRSISFTRRITTHTKQVRFIYSQLEILRVRARWC